MAATGGMANLGGEVWKADRPIDEGHLPELPLAPLSPSPRAGEQQGSGLGGRGLAHQL